MPPEQNQEKQINPWKRYFWFLLIVALGSLALFGWTKFQQWNLANTIKQEYQTQQSKYEDFLRELASRDWGESTPEATYDKYVGYLKAGDLESAVKYHDPEQQEAELKRLENKGIDNKLDDYIETIEEVRWKGERIVVDSERIYYIYSFKVTEDVPVIIGGKIIDVIKAGTQVANKIDFYKKEYDNKVIWKVEF